MSSPRLLIFRKFYTKDILISTPSSSLIKRFFPPTELIPNPPPFIRYPLRVKTILHLTIFSLSLRQHEIDLVKISKSKCILVYFFQEAEDTMNQLRQQHQDEVINMYPFQWICPFISGKLVAVTKVSYILLNFWFLKFNSLFNFKIRPF